MPPARYLILIKKLKNQETYNMPNIVVEIPTITPELWRRLNCIRIKNNKAKTANNNSHFLVVSKRKISEIGISAPIAIPKYL
jgi:hypothetical protein